MNDSVIRITNEQYEMLLKELSASKNQQLREFANAYSKLSDIEKANLTIDKYEYIMIQNLL